MSCSYQEILAAVACGAVRIPAEMAGYLALAAGVTVREGERFDASGLVLEESGSVTPHPNGGTSAPEGLLRWVLGELLTRASTENPGLAAAALNGNKGLRHLCTELESALVPINRGAARRSLVRLHRQVLATASQWQEHAGHLEPEASAVPFPLTQVSEPQAPRVVCPTPVAVRVAEPRRQALPSLPRNVQQHLTPILGTQVQAIAAWAPEPSDLAPSLSDPSLTPHVPPDFEPIVDDLGPPPALETAEHVPVRSELWQLLAALTDEALDLPLETIFGTARVKTPPEVRASA